MTGCVAVWQILHFLAHLIIGFSSLNTWVQVWGFKSLMKIFNTISFFFFGEFIDVHNLEDYHYEGVKCGPLVVSFPVTSSVALWHESILYLFI